jgi:MFS family permease
LAEQVTLDDHEPAPTSVHVEPARPVSGWAPLRRPLFRDRFWSSVVSNTGGWMQDTAATWLMTALTASPLLIALMQTAASLPVLLLGLPAGALADILDRRKLLLFFQAWMLVAAAILALLCFAGHVGPWTLIALTTFLAFGSAMNNPAWQAIVPELVPPEELANAISLNSAGFNLARALGPAAGGLMVAAFASARVGAGAVFFFNAVTFVVVLVVLYKWKRPASQSSALPAERIVGSMRAGIRYITHARAVRGILLRAFLLTSSVSAMWALLSLVAARMHGGALGYGLLNGCVGAGAVLGAVLLPRARARFSAETLVLASSVVFSGALVVLALVPIPVAVVGALLCAGVAWTTTTSTFNIAVQTSVSRWVQARALGTYQMTFQGGMALGAALWGFVAEKTSLRWALLGAAATLLAGLPVALRFRIMSGATGDLTSRGAAGLVRAAPVVVIEPRPEEGPVLISIQFHIDAADAEAFVAAMEDVRTIRLRDGAIRWGVFRDPADPAHFMETFLVESWAEYLRQRERMTVADLAVREKAFGLHRGAEKPAISRMLFAADRGRRRA